MGATQRSFIPLPLPLEFQLMPQKEDLSQEFHEYQGMGNSPISRASFRQEIYQDCYLLQLPLISYTSCYDFGVSAIDRGEKYYSEVL